MDRRELLVTATTCSCSVVLAGCSLNPFDCGANDRITISTTDVNLTADQRENLSIIDATELPEGETEIVRNAIRDDEYAECYPGSDELQSFVDRVESNKGEQFERYDGSPPEYLNSVYVNEDGTYYRLYVTVEDEVVSDP